MRNEETLGSIMPNPALKGAEEKNAQNSHMEEFLNLD
jgi:hypothetical protein